MSERTNTLLEDVLAFCASEQLDVGILLLLLAATANDPPAASSEPPHEPFSTHFYPH